MSTTPILQVEDLSVEFATRGGAVHAVDGVNLTIEPGQTLGLVGESGSGKSVTARAIMRLVPTPPGRYTGGRILFEGADLLTLSEREMQEMRGGQIAMVFQDPMTFLNPVYTAGEQVAEAIRVHQGETFIQPEIASRALRGSLRPSGDLVEPLSDREREVLVMLAQGIPNKEIADRLHIAEGTVKNHVSNILDKLRVQNRTQAADLARRRGLV